MQKEHINKISKYEPSDFKQFRLNSYEMFKSSFNPIYGPTIKEDFDKYNYENTFLNIDKYDDGVIYCDINTASKKYKNLFDKYFNNIIKYDEHKYTMFNSAMFCGGMFIYIPKNKKNISLDIKCVNPIERTIIVVDENSSLEINEFINNNKNILNNYVVEIYVNKNAKLIYTSNQNLEKNIYNLNIKRASILENGHIDYYLNSYGSYITYEYPCIRLEGDNSCANVILNVKSEGIQEIDLGSKIIHMGKNTKSNIDSNFTVSKKGYAAYRGLVEIKKEASNSVCNINSNIFINDNYSRCDIIPKHFVNNNTSVINQNSNIKKLEV